MSMYRHFRSKNDLILAVIERRGLVWTEGWVQAETARRATDPAERLLAIFDIFDEWFRQPGFEGCTFVNMLLEVTDRDNAVHQASRDHLRLIREFVRGLAEAAGVARPGHVRPPVAHPHEGLDRVRRRGRCRRRPRRPPGRRAPPPARSWRPPSPPGRGWPPRPYPASTTCRAISEPGEPGSPVTSMVEPSWMSINEPADPSARRYSVSDVRATRE